MLFLLASCSIIQFHMERMPSPISTDKSHRLRRITNSLLPVFFILLGTCLRLRQFAFNRSLWSDEAWLALNVVQRPLGVLLTKPQAANQTAPVGFLLLSDVLVTLLGPTDLVLRITPFLASLLALLVAYRIGLLSLESTAARATFLGLICCSPLLIYFSSEFKQYSSDVLVVLLILWVGLRYGSQRHSAALLAVTGAIGLWFAHVAVFTMAAVGTVLTIEVIVRRQWRELLPLAAVGAIWTASLAADFMLSLKFLAANDYLSTYWQKGFAPVLINSLAELRWYWDRALGFVFMAFGERGRGIGWRPEWYSPANLALLAIVVAGVVRLFSRCRRMAGFAVMSVAFVLVASGLKVYPFGSRVILFLVPLAYLAASGLVDWLASTPRPATRVASIVLAIGLVVSLLAPSLVIAAKPHNRSDIKGAMAYLLSHRVPNDALALSTWSEPAYAFYKPHFGPDRPPVVAIISRENDADAFLRKLCESDTLRPTWIIYSHRFSERLDFLAKVRQVAPQITSWESEDSGAYLLDFSQPGVCDGVK
jgi:hypothetical protein